jgi:hypothetical protein
VLGASGHPAGLLLMTKSEAELIRIVMVFALTKQLEVVAIQQRLIETQQQLIEANFKLLERRIP